MTDLIYYLNGQYVPAEKAALPLDDLGIVRGYGVFDLLRTYAGVPFCLREHIVRLENSAQQIGLELPWTTDQLISLVTETYALNHVPNASIRIVITGGSSANFMTAQGKPSLAIMVQPLAPYDETHYRDGCTAITTNIERIMPTVKSLNYIGAIMAMAEADKLGAVEAIYRTGDGNLTEATRSNLFVVHGRRLITPADAVLIGITRQVVLEVARREFEVVEGPIQMADLTNADEAFLTSTTKEILPLIRVDDILIGHGKPGPVTQRLANLFRFYVEDLVAEAQSLSHAASSAT